MPVSYVGIEFVKEKFGGEIFSLILHIPLSTLQSHLSPRNPVAGQASLDLSHFSDRDVE